jgi:hypothetical protein
MSDTNLNSATPADDEIELEPQIIEGETTDDTEPEPAPKLSRRDALIASFNKAELSNVPANHDAPVEKSTDPVDPIKPPAAPAAAAPAAIKAPQSWSPAVRDKFGTLAPEVQQEITKREREIETKLGQTSQERRIAQDFMSVSSPYQAHFNTIGVHPMEATKELLRTGYILHTGTTQQKTELLSQMIKKFVPQNELAALDDALAAVYGGQSVPQQQGLPPEINARLSKIEETFQNNQQLIQQKQDKEVNTTIEAFANDPKNEYFNDVAPQMIGLLQSGVCADLQSAYEQASWANPTVRKAMQAKQVAQQQRVKAGNASLTNNGPRTNSGLAPLNAKGKTRRQILSELLPD